MALLHTFSGSFTYILGGEAIFTYDDAAWSASASRFQCQLEAPSRQRTQTVTVAASYGLTISGGWFAAVDSETTETRRGHIPQPVDLIENVADRFHFLRSFRG